MKYHVKIISSRQRWVESYKEDLSDAVFFAERQAKKLGGAVVKIYEAFRASDHYEDHQMVMHYRVGLE